MTATGGLSRCGIGSRRAGRTVFLVGSLALACFAPWGCGSGEDSELVEILVVSHGTFNDYSRRPPAALADIPIVLVAVDDVDAWLDGAFYDHQFEAARLDLSGLKGRRIFHAALEDPAYVVITDLYGTAAVDVVSGRYLVCAMYPRILVYGTAIVGCDYVSVSTDATVDVSLGDWDIESIGIDPENWNYFHLYSDVSIRVVDSMSDSVILERLESMALVKVLSFGTVNSYLDNAPLVLRPEMVVAFISADHVDAWYSHVTGDAEADAGSVPIGAIPNTAISSSAWRVESPAQYVITDDNGTSQTLLHPGEYLVCSYIPGLNAGSIFGCEHLTIGPGTIIYLYFDDGRAHLDVGGGTASDAYQRLSCQQQRQQGQRNDYPAHILGGRYRCLTR